MSSDKAKWPFPCEEAVGRTYYLLPTVKQQTHEHAQASKQWVIDYHISVWTYKQKWIYNKTTERGKNKMRTLVSAFSSASSPVILSESSLLDSCSAWAATSCSCSITFSKYKWSARAKYIMTQYLACHLSQQFILMKLLFPIQSLLVWIQQKPHALPSFAANMDRFSQLDILRQRYKFTMYWKVHWFFYRI